MSPRPPSSISDAGERIFTTGSPELSGVIDAYATAQRVSRAKAIRELLALGIEAWRRAQSPSEPETFDDRAYPASAR